MKRKRHTPERSIHKLRQADTELAAGQPIAAICQKLQMSEQTLHRWRDQYGGIRPSCTAWGTHDSGAVAPRHSPRRAASGFHARR